MNKVIIRTREDELTNIMYRFGSECASEFIYSVERKQYGDDWCDCMYGSADNSLSCWVKMSKSGTISACVFNK